MTCLSFGRRSKTCCKCGGERNMSASPSTSQAQPQPTEKAPATASAPSTLASAGQAHTCCSFVRDDLRPPTYSAHASSATALSGRLQEMASTIEHEVRQLDATLRDLSMAMHDKPEILWQEHATHDLFVRFFEGRSSEGWKVKPHAYGLETAWEARFEHRPDSKDARTIGFQSELDALPGIGHACGHNLIAISGVAAALSVAAALRKHDVAGTVVLLGTPAEEGGGGKLRLLEAGAYKSYDAALMVHPAPTSGTGAMLAVQPVMVRYTGATAHAGAAPWEGVNALDAAVLAYNNISALRQQMPPEYRVHGIIEGDNWAANVIPGASRLHYNVRAPTISGLKAFVAKVDKCFQAAALATGCSIEVEWEPAYADVWNTPLLSSTYAAVLEQRYGKVVPNDDFTASTDFGNVCYALPALHAEYAIHLDDPKTQGNHTVGFTDAAGSKEAHERTLEAAVGIAVTGARVLLEEDFAKQIKDQWRKWRDGADGP
ncbi:uncharacterized protein PFL1_03379 [Pseudozyma flocculosa PF-1]|uniref:Related to amidohydrolase n=2 Tax=Pseudozyma flocculosa TaxID=84751 RepID=A0A5C3F6D1_9BASI|nr:uncharacterized protein PFL1_03379 [Pseudozyma flocculosa PF-1]EPQ29090.1 hypothetical protein PFL1_03379 [Pseudozyma flocculosa PF-1]SPO40084.1 related to amidohydrolase [Pseudozyma flocculosa]